jgi:hypothetical protein
MKTCKPAETELATFVGGTELLNQVPAPRTAADVKCYFCGHISGQIIARRDRPLKVSDFVPRPGYTGPELRPGMRLRCERCSGPVFLEDAGPVAAPRVSSDDAFKRRLARREKAA